LLYGAGVATVALVGDLTASMLKRDGHVKDFGNVFPGHGGILDRLDGFIFVAPLAFCVLPRLAPPGSWVPFL
jgi:phosphatidate cytidylyltransferase